MTAFMVSLAGIPPTGGFWAKILIFTAAIDRGGYRGPGWPPHARELRHRVFYYFAVPSR